MNAPADSGMVRITSLQPDDEFTFAPRRGRFRVVVRGGQGLGVIYQGVDAEAKEVMGDNGLLVAMSDWRVWPLPATTP